MPKLIAIFISVAMLTICTVLALYMPTWLLLALLSLMFLTNLKRGKE